MGKIVYHGTYSAEPPHKYEGTFHVGTLQAAHDRLADEEETAVYGETRPAAIARVHKYEISDEAPTSRRTWDDPLTGTGAWEMDDEAPKYYPVPESGSRKRIYPYENIREDKGSISYIVPSAFVGESVKYLGQQFQSVVGEPQEVHALYNAMRIMLGGKK
jgi:hypothetical protein